jgi:hypothetical protein
MREIMDSRERRVANGAPGVRLTSLDSCAHPIAPSDCDAASGRRERCERTHKVRRTTGCPIRTCHRADLAPIQAVFPAGFTADAGLECSVTTSRGAAATTTRTWSPRVRCCQCCYRRLRSVMPRAGWQGVISVCSRAGSANCVGRRCGAQARAAARSAKIGDGRGTEDRFACRRLTPAD